MPPLYVLPVTPPGEGGISITQLIGTAALKAILKFFRPKHPAKTNSLRPHRLYLGYFYHQDKVVDEVIINVIPAQESFSGLLTIEINSHGGVMPAKKIISALVQSGARPVRSIVINPVTDTSSTGLPKRRNGVVVSRGTSNGARRITGVEVIQLAHRHKRIDLFQAEALSALLTAPTPLAGQVFLDQYNGALSREWRNILNLSARTKSGNLPALERRINKLLGSAALGLTLNYPKRLAIIGRPNTGKSTLFNALLERERTIVHPTPGTTRDVVAELFAIDGIPFTIVDMAGWRRPAPPRQPQDVIESLGIKKAKSEIKKADIIICLLDGSEPFTVTDKEIIRQLPSKPVITVINKSDLSARLETAGLPAGAMRISALTRVGLEELKARILSLAGITAGSFRPGQAVLFTQRQYQMLFRLKQQCLNNASGRFRQNRIDGDQ